MSAEVITVVCKCGQGFRVKSAAIGRQVKCPKCKTACQVVAPPETTQTKTASSESGAQDAGGIPVVKGDKQPPTRWQGEIPDFSGSAKKATPAPSIVTAKGGSSQTTPPKIVMEGSKSDAIEIPKLAPANTEPDSNDVPEFAADELSIESDNDSAAVKIDAAKIDTGPEFAATSSGSGASASTSPNAATAGGGGTPHATPPAMNPYTTSAEPTQTVSHTSLPLERSYPMLELIRKLYFGLACLILGLAVIYTLVIPVLGMTQEGVAGLFAGLLTAVPILIMSAIWSATLLAASEVIKLFLDIQSNTLVTANAVQPR
ncbi:hypothetical protein SH528x_001390 [Novipirellula sp. SH528]|uniref:hypothetical protein n=1 Tax=Novipirellula sp. SH528 TaxID=3454466 RepID=UPI003FA10ADA